MAASKQIVFVNQSSGYLMIDIVNAFRDHYDQRVLLAGILKPRNHGLDNEVKVEKIIEYDRSNTLKRLFTWIWGFIQILFLIKMKYSKAHLFLVSNPPFTPLISLFCRNSYTLLIYDVFPDAISDFGLLSENSIVLKAWQKLNKRAYGKAFRIFTITQGMKKKIRKYSSSEASIEVIPLWTDNQFLKPMDKKENPFAKEHGLLDKFVILYSGNFGKAHHVDKLVDYASRINKKNLLFLIIGDGEVKYAIKKEIEKKRLKNCLLLPWQPVDRLPYSLAVADLAVVSLGKQAANIGMPSKFFSYLSVGAPILCLSPFGTELSEIVASHKVGKSFEPENEKDIIEFIEELFDDPDLQRLFSENALELSKQYTSDNAHKFTE